MLYCPRCKTSVRADERSTLRTHGMCTPCYLHRLPLVDEQREIAHELASRELLQPTVRPVAVA